MLVTPEVVHFIRYPFVLYTCLKTSTYLKAAGRKKGKQYGLLQLDISSKSGQMGGTRRLGQGRLTRLSSEQQMSERRLFRQQTEMLNVILGSGQHYLPLYKRRWSSSDHSRPSRIRERSEPDSNDLALALPPTRSVSAHAPSPTQEVMVHVKSPRWLSSLDEGQTATRLRHSRSHGSRLRCEILGPEACQKCLRVLDQAVVVNSCPICLASRKVPLSTTEFRTSASLLEQRQWHPRHDFRAGLHSPVQIFNRVRQRDVMKKRGASHQGKQPKAIQFNEDGKRSCSPTQNLPDIAQRSDTYDSLCQPEELSPKSYELRVHVTFGKGTKGGMHNEGVN